MKIDMHELQNECEQARHADAKAAKRVFEKVLSTDDKIISVCLFDNLFMNMGS